MLLKWKTEAKKIGLYTNVGKSKIEVSNYCRDDIKFKIGSSTVEMVEDFRYARIVCLSHKR